MERSVINVKTLISSLLIVCCALSHSAMAEGAMADVTAAGIVASEDVTKTTGDINQYGLEFDGLTFLPAYKTTLGIEQTFETDFSINKVNSAGKQTEAPAWKVEMDYQDKTADIFSPYHGINTELSQRLNNTSQEYQTRLDYQFEQLTSQAVLKFSPDSYGLGKYYNYELGVAIPVKNIFSLQTHYGWNRFDKKPEKGGMSDYQDWSIGVSTNYRGMTLKLDYIDINASENSEECGQSFTCEGKTVFSIIKNF